MKEVKVGRDTRVCGHWADHVSTAATANVYEKDLYIFSRRDYEVDLKMKRNQQDR